MGFDFIKKLPTPEEIRNQYPIDAEIQAVKDARDKELRDVFTGKSDKFLAIIGPCSADNEDAVLDYLTRLRNVQEKIADKVLIVPRVYTNKPRTTGEGYKGMVHQPDPEKQPNLLAGLVAIRKMHIHAIRTSGMTCADEMLYPENYRYLSDLLSYVAVGARSVEDQQHRLTVSGMEVPAGMKNPTSGDFSVMLNSVYAAQHPHHFVYRGYEVETTGNPLTHVVLRGAVSKHGNSTQNYHYEDLIRLCDMYAKMDLVNPAAIIDANHSNSGKQFKEQIRIADGQKLSFTQQDIEINGHAIECRICAEDTENNFMPSPGIIRQLTEPNGIGVRIDSYVYEGYEIPVYYDPMIGKLIVWATTRAYAIERMRRVLYEYKITGLKTNLSYLKRIMHNPDFVKGEYNTLFIAKNARMLQRSNGNNEEIENIAMIAAYMDYLMNLEENTSTQLVDTRPISRWREFGLQKGVLRI